MTPKTIVKSALAAALLMFTPAFAVKYIAVLETGIDERSGVSADITSAEIALITAELRREALKNLPRDRFSVITSETVMSMGGSVLEECSEENCVILLGSRIGADYIARATVSKFRTRLTLSVEIYETNNGTLVAFSDPIRSEGAGELLEKTGPVCASMFRTLAETLSVAPKPSSAAEAEEEAAVTNQLVYDLRTESRRRRGLAWVFGVAYVNDVGGGLAWEGSGEVLSMPTLGTGVNIFFDAAYVEAIVGYSVGGGQWESPADMPYRLPKTSRSYINIGLFAKYPVGFEKFLGGLTSLLTMFPLIGIDYEAALPVKFTYSDGTVVEHKKSTSALWLKFGGGLDFHLSEAVYLRLELLYGARTSNESETKLRDEYMSQYPGGNPVQTRLGHGMTARTGVGVGF